MEDKNNLQEKWNRLANELALEKKLYYHFLYWYSYPYRAYHNLNHIENCLDEFEDAKHLIENKAEVEIALWFHDAIHYNEEESAELAYRILKEQGLLSFGQRVSDLILTTKHNKIPEQNDAKFLVDIDLSILGKPVGEFDEYERNIRKEYDWVPEELFRPKRANILQEFLNRPIIYFTDFFRQKYEEQARINLERSLAGLK